MHYYKRNIGDYHKKAGRLSILQHGIYMLLMDAIYDREKFPTKAEAIEWVWASTNEEIEATEFVLRKFFTNGNGIYKQKRIEEEIKAFADFREKQKIKGKRGGRPKNPLGSEKNPPGFKNNPTVTQRAQNKTLTTNHKPLTTNQLDIPSGDGICGNSKSSPVPYQKIIDLYHKHLPNLPKVVKLTNKRKTAIRNRWKDEADNLEFWEDYFKYCAKSRFMHGNNDRGWTADIDFLIREDVIVKTQEGKYHV